MSKKQKDIQQSLFGDEREYFNRKRTWTATKHRIMLRYIQAFCYNLGGSQGFQSNYLNYVDGFAGEGKYDEGIGIENFIGKSDFWNRYKTDFLDSDGSPLIALKLAKIFELEKRVTLRCFFTEEDKERNQKLNINCSLIGEGLSYKIYDYQRFDKALVQIMNELENYPTLFFLDAFGVQGVTFEQICSIADYVSKNKGELFLLFHNRAVARNAGFYKTDYQDYKKQKTAETYTQHLTKLLGDNSDLDWKPRWLEYQQEEQKFEKWALKYFKDRLQKDSCFKGIASFEIKEEYNDTRPQYHIVVGSNHPQKALGVFLNDFVYQENELLFYQDDKSGKYHKFMSQEWERQNNERISTIKPQIIDILRSKNQDMTLEDAITFIILEIGNLGYLSRAKYREIFLKLYEEKIIEARELGARGKLTLKNFIRVVK
ncbi:three-Cys-motif partner protein TcmP [Anabaena sp. UHCC 0451]|uniref:three-Cys-motif partner protein TcmP n=1 Tax=Anabaena sp. UHCC 0451 TaxID=2055235 RepID=UPI002B213C6B|nr:three-Cys-motif partner protein TcmP [Anabaena sp. UHCC 0451]MEA5579303.1 three-Cys-motif partner protein TcmP [Anabaena sp. UHCC 0451]